jgi:cell division protein ZapA
MDAKTPVQVTIFGQSYPLRVEEDKAYVLELAAYVDRKMREVTLRQPGTQPSKVAILASLNIADELFKERARQQTQTRELDHQAARLNAVLDELLQDSPSR